LSTLDKIVLYETFSKTLNSAITCSVIRCWCMCFYQSLLCETGIYVTLSACPTYDFHKLRVCGESIGLINCLFPYLCPGNCPSYQEVESTPPPFKSGMALSFALSNRLQQKGPCLRGLGCSHSWCTLGNSPLGAMWTSPD
jgi:hypothetical protein